MPLQNLISNFSKYDCAVAFSTTWLLFYLYNKGKQSFKYRRRRLKGMNQDYQVPGIKILSMSHRRAMNHLMRFPGEKTFELIPYDYLLLLNNYLYVSHKTKKAKKLLEIYDKGIEEILSKTNTNFKKGPVGTVELFEEPQIKAQLEQLKSKNARKAYFLKEGKKTEKYLTRWLLAYEDFMVHCTKQAKKNDPKSMNLFALFALNRISLSRVYGDSFGLSAAQECKKYLETSKAFYEKLVSSPAFAEMLADNNDQDKKILRFLMLLDCRVVKVQHFLGLDYGSKYLRGKERAIGEIIKGGLLKKLLNKNLTLNS